MFENIDIYVEHGCGFKNRCDFPLKKAKVSITP